VGSANVCEAEDFLGERAVILAETGRRMEALQQVEGNLNQFPEAAWTHSKAGDAYKQFGDLPAAEAAYRRALAMADRESDPSDRVDAVAYLAELFHKTGRAAEADALRQAEEARFREHLRSLAPARLREHLAELPDGVSPEQNAAGDLQTEEAAPAGQEGAAAVDASLASAPPPAAVRREGPKVGRNDPCPCGSGRKFKRCCGR
jgi:tetratricopeptide (TPR) repeat protein